MFYVAFIKFTIKSLFLTLALDLYMSLSPRTTHGILSASTQDPLSDRYSQWGNSCLVVKLIDVFLKQSPEP